ncbi:MAG: PfkB family carbohydrate kinase [Oscillospiraceae bacterium]|jgi:fructoselysine 6-kinase|nr:PfkB family carbohydrate kinase [Oscillospiraceae bacterium]
MKVLGFGDCVVDVYLHTRTAYPGGNALNFAVFAKENGADAAFLGTMGDDVYAKQIVLAMDDRGIDYSHSPVLHGEAARCPVNIIDGDRVFAGNDPMHNGGGICVKNPPVLSEDDLAYMKGFDLIHCGCYAEIEDEMDKLRDLGPLLTYDFSSDDYTKEDKWLEKVCKKLDLGLFSGDGLDDAGIEALVKKAMGYGCKYVLVTMGADGQRFFDGENVYSGKAKFIKAIDTMGAGDSFCTAFLVSLLKCGWRKNVDITREMVETSLKAGAEYSAKNCLVNGSFGYGLQY